MRKTLLFGISLFFLAACTAAPTPEDESAYQATLAAAVQSTQTASLATPETTEPLETPAAPLESPMPAESPASGADAHPLAGLVYLYDDRLWLIQANGEAIAILHKASYATPSTDGKRVLYATEEAGAGDLFLLDLASGETRQLTDTPEISERFPRFVPGSDMVAYHFVAVDQMGISAGYLGAVDLNTGEMRALDTQNSSSSPFALRADGASFAYGGAGAFTYAWEGGVQPLEPLSYGLRLQRVFFDNAAWGPDGSQLAWSIHGEFNAEGDYQAAVVVFDLQNHTHQILKSYPLAAGGSFTNPITWSPDGRWMAAGLSYLVPNKRSSTLWVAPLDGGAEFIQEDAASPVWAPDGERLIFTQWPSQGNFTYLDAKLVLLHAGDWTSEILDLPLGSQVLDWVHLD